MLEVGLVVGAFVKLFKFSAVNDEVDENAGVSTKPADGVMVNLTLRDAGVRLVQELIDYQFVLSRLRAAGWDNDC